jgi:hypothetical protein
MRESPVSERAPAASIRTAPLCRGVRVPAAASVLLPLLLAVLAGCAEPRRDADAADPCAAGCAFTSEDLPGVEMLLTHRADGRSHEVEATVRNEAAMVYWHLWVPHCALEPWSDQMTGPRGAVQPREPEAHCQPCGTDALAAGEVMRRTFRWDERVWDWDTESMREAPEGAYRWEIRFAAEPDRNAVCGGQRAVRGGLDLVVA